MNEFICGHCFIDFGSKADLNEHFEKVIKTKAQRKMARTMKKFEPILVAVFNAGFETGTGYLKKGEKTMGFKTAMKEIKTIVEGIENGKNN